MKNQSKEKVSSLPIVTKKHLKEQHENAVKMLNLIVRTKVAPSSVHGVGLFTLRDIKKGEKLYADAQYQALDIPYSMFKKLRPEIAEQILGRWPQIINGSHFIYPDCNFMAFCNHSDIPNYDGVKDEALIDMPKGTEVFEDYRKIKGYQSVYKWLA